MSKPAKLPGLAGVATGNRALDAWLQAAAEHLEVRAGTRGDALEKVVTHRDLEAMGLSAGRSVMGGMRSGSAGGVMVQSGGGSVGFVPFETFATELRNTALYQGLLKKLDDATRFDRVPEKVRALLLADLAAEAALRGADIQRVEYKSQTDLESLAYTVDTVTASLKRDTAAVRQTVYANVTATEATAGIVDQVQARLNDVGGVTIEAAMTATASRVTGLAGEYSVKINAGGAVAGFGLAATEDLTGATTSAFIIQADKFAIVSPSYTGGATTTPPANLIPFGVDADGIFMNGAVQINAGGVSLAVAAAQAGLYIAASSPQWQVATTGLAVNSTITLTAVLRSSLTGMVTWSKTGAGTLAPAAGTTNIWVLKAVDQTDDSNTYTATLVSGGITYTNSVTITRMRDGAKGDAGVTGALGSLIGYGYNYGIVSSAWSDTLANRVTSNLLLGASGTTGLATTDHLMLGDTVTLSNGSSFAQTKYWSGAAWLSPGVVIDGNLLVNGTVSATKIAAGSITTGGGNASINIGSTSFVGGITSPMHVVKRSAVAYQTLISALNDKDDSVAIWGASVYNASYPLGNAVSGTWHASAADATAGRWSLIGILGSKLNSAAVSGNVYNDGANSFGGWFRYFSTPSDSGSPAILTEARLASSTRALIATGPVQLLTANSPLILNADAGVNGSIMLNKGAAATPGWLAAGASGHVLTSGGAGALPSWQTPAGAGAVTYGSIQTALAGSTGSTLNLSTTFRSTGTNVPLSGTGIEMAYYYGQGFVISCTRDASGDVSAYTPMQLRGSTIAMNATPTFPTPATGSNDTTAATTAFVKAQGYTSVSYTSQLTNNSGFVTSSGSVNYASSAGYATSAGSASSASSCSGNAASATTVGGWKTCGGSGVGGSAVSFPFAFSDTTNLGLSIAPLDGFAAGVQVISTTGFTVRTYDMAGVTASVAFRWVATGT